MSIIFFVTLKSALCVNGEKSQPISKCYRLQPIAINRDNTVELNHYEELNPCSMTIATLRVESMKYYENSLADLLETLTPCPLHSLPQP